MKFLAIVTFYCLACPACHTTGQTANGSKRPGVAVARSSGIRLGARVSVRGLGTRIANDYLPRGTAANRIDWCLAGKGSHRRGIHQGRQKRWVRVGPRGRG
jgi:hypothetical protein